MFGAVGVSVRSGDAGVSQAPPPLLMPATVSEGKAGGGTPSAPHGSERPIAGARARCG